MTNASEQPPDARNPWAAPEPPWAEGLPKPPPWTVSGEETVVFENPWMRLTVQDAVAPTGVAAHYAVMRPRGIAVGVLPIHGDGTVTLVGQQRFALMNHSWEMPEGGAMDGEDPLEGCRRELAEEAGLKARTWMQVLRMELSNSITDERAVAWLAWDLAPATGQLDATEIIQTVRVPFIDLLGAVHRGEVRDAFTVATTLRAYYLARENLLPGWLAHVMLAPREGGPE